MSNELLKKNFPDQVIYFIKKKIKTLIILSVIVLILLFSLIVFKNIKKKQDIKIAEQYAQAVILIKQKNITESKLLLEAVINENHRFYSPLALYFIIDNKIEIDSLKIISFYDKILKNNSIDKENLNLIKIKKAIYLINLDKENQVIKTLNPIINSSSVWKNTAINLISEYFISKGQQSKADEYINLLSSNIKN